MRIRSLIIFGGVATVGALSFLYAINTNHPAAPSAEGLTIEATGAEPADTYDAAANNICGKSIDTILMCADLKKKYPALTSATITATVQFSKYYGHKNPSALLALQLVESKGDVIDGYSDQSTAFGPFHYLVDTFCDKLITDIKVVGKDIRRENLALLQKIKQHFPNNPAVIDEVAAKSTAYMSGLRNDLSALKHIDKALNKEQLAELTTEIKTRVKTRRAEMRETLLTKYPQAVIAIQYVDVLTRIKPENLYDGSAYAEHILSSVGAEQLQAMLVQERNARDDVAKAIAQKTVAAPAQTIKAANIKKMLASINAANGSNYKELVIPAYTGDIYPAFSKTFGSRAPGNFGLFFKTQKIRDEKTVPATVKGAPPTKTITIRTLVLPRSANEVQAEILRRWEEHHKNARPLDPFAKEFANAPTAPSAPAYVRTAQNTIAAPRVAAN